MEIPFVGGAYTSRSRNTNAQRCVNLYPKIDNQQAKDKVILAGTPGIVEFADISGFLSEDLLIHYKFENYGNELVDFQGNYTGTLVNFPTDNTQWVVGLDNNALNFDNTNPGDYVDIGDTLQSLMRDSYSVSLWCKMDDGRPPIDNYFFGSRINLGGYHQAFMYLDTTGLLTSYYGNTTGGANFTTLDPVWADGAMSSFAHVVTTVEQTGTGIQILIYINGVLVDSNVTLNGLGTAVDMSGWTSTNNMFLGGWNRDAALWYPMNGVLDEVRVYSYALSADTVVDVYNLHSGA